MGGHSSKVTKEYSRPIEGTKTAGFSEIFRNPKVISGLLSTPNPGIHSMKDVIKGSVAKFGKKDCLGNIKIRQEEIDGKVEEIR